MINMKVAQVIGTYEYGGIGNIITNIARGLKEEGIETEIVCVRKKTTPKDVKVVSFGTRLRPSILWGSIKMINYLKKFDIVHIHGSLPIIFTLFKHSKKIAYTHHGWHIGVKETELKTRLGSIFFLKLYQLLSSQVDVFIGISKWSQKEIKLFFNRESYLLRNPINEKMFRPIKNVEKWRIGSPMILSVGRNCLHKGHKYEIIAMKEVLKIFPNAKLVIVGEDYQSLIPLVKDLKLTENVVFLGRVSDRKLPLLYNACDIYLTATFWELFGLTLLEALFCGKPVVGRNAFAMSEIIKESRAGVLFNSNEEIPHAIITAINKRKKLEKNALKFRKKYLKENNWKKYIKSLETIYKKVIL